MMRVSLQDPGGGFWRISGWSSLEPRRAIDDEETHFAIGTWVLTEVLRLIFTLIKPFGAGTGMSLPISVVREK